MTTTPATSEATLEDLYRTALDEGPTLTVFAGGDASTMFDFARDAFEARFPGLHLTMKVDLSKYHAATIDRQHQEGRLEASVAHLQTLHDFDRWKAEDRLLPYRPIGAEHIYDEFKDPDGTWHGLFVIAFSHVINADCLTAAEYPPDAIDLLAPRFSERIALTYPNDDDAVLFTIKRLVDRYGRTFLDRLAAQRPKLVRGLPAAQALVERGETDAALAAWGPLTPYPGTASRFLVPATDPFTAWAQSAAIFRDAPSPAAAKLYLSWWLTDETQRAWPQWSVRSDIAAPGHAPSVFDTRADPASFATFMRDRAGVERFRFAVEQVFGTAAGPSPLEPASEPTAARQTSTTATADRNRLVVERLINGLRRGDTSVFDDLVTPGYKQHNPRVPDGREAAKDFFRAIGPIDIDVHRIVAEEDLVAVHAHYATWNVAVVDVFRLDGTGHIVEHWDVAQQVPETTANGHDMFTQAT